MSRQEMYMSRENELADMHAAGATPQQIEEAATGGFMMSVLAPEVRDVAPPTDTGRIFIQKQVTLDGTFTVNDSNIQGSQHRISTAKGMILFFPYRGIQSIAVRYGFVPSGTSIAYGGFNLNGNIFDTSNHNALLQNFSYLLELVLPYAATGPNATPGDQIDISPNMAESFAFTMNGSGVISLYSDTVPIGNTDLSGYVTATANGTNEDSAQTALGAYTPVSLAQSAVTTKDVVLKQKISEGVVALIGPDIRNEFVPPDEVRHDRLSGIWAAGNMADAPYINALGGVWAPTADQYGYNGGAPTNAAQRKIGMGMWFVTPWALSVSTSGPTLPLQVIKVDSTGEFDNLDIDFFFDATVSSNVNVGSWVWQVEVIAQHVFATCTSSDWEAYYEQVTEVQTFGCYGATGTPVLNNAFSKASFRPKVSNTSYLKRGKYLGTIFQLAGRCVSNNSASATSVAFSGNVNTGPDFSPRFAIRAREAGIQSSTGPFRALQWNNVANGQTIQVKGNINCLCVPQAALAPFVQSAGRLAPQALNPAGFIFLQKLFKGPGELKRVYNRLEYQRILEKIGTRLNPESLAYLLGNDAATLGAASAAGCFQAGGLFSGIGSAIGGHFFGPGGSAIGGALGRMGDSMFGASGEWGGPGAAGEWGGPMAGGGAVGSRRPRYMG